MSNIPGNSQSLSTDDGGWSTGNESSYSSYSSYSSDLYDETSPDQGDIESQESNDEDDELLDDTLSYDGIEDDSEWISDTEKLGRSGGPVLPTVEEQGSGQDSSVWRFELSQRTTTSHQYSIASRDENVVARFESHSEREGFDGESEDLPDTRSTTLVSSSRIPLPHRARAEGPSSRIVDNKNESSKQTKTDSGSRESTSDSPDQLPYIAPYSSKSTSKEKSGSSSNVFVLSSPSIHSSESPRDQSFGLVYDSSKSTSNDTSSAAGIALSSSTSESNFPAERKRRVRRQQPRGSTKSSYPTMASSDKKKVIFNFPKPSANESNISNSESIKARTPPTASKTPRKKPLHSSPRMQPRQKHRTRRPGSNRKPSSLTLNKPVERRTSKSGGVKQTIRKFENKIESSPKTEGSKSPRTPIRPKKEAHQLPRASPSNNKAKSNEPSQKITITPINAENSILDSSDFSRSISVLRDLNCGLKTTTKQIHATINNEGYKNFVRMAYQKLLEARPRLKYLLSLSEWLHVHMLLLYAKIFDCELQFYGIKLPQEFRIGIPDMIMIFEPIAAVISSIGIVDEADSGITYIPVARSFRGNDVYKPHNKDDVTEFLEWNQYDWNASWYQVEGARLERRMLAAKKNINIPKPEIQFDDSKLEAWQQLAVEKWLGWDEDLWFSYKQACYVLGRCGHFVSIPRGGSNYGSYAWLLPRHTNEEGSFVRIPRPNLSQDCWMIALMLDMCALEPKATSTWYHETNSVKNVQHLIESFLGAAMTSTKPKT